MWSLSNTIFLLQVPGSVLKQMPPPSGGVGGVGGGIFPPQLSPQHIAMLSSIYPPHIQFQLVGSYMVHAQDFICVGHSQYTHYSSVCFSFDPVLCFLAGLSAATSTATTATTTAAIAAEPAQVPHKHTSTGRPTTGTILTYFLLIYYLTLKSCCNFEYFLMLLQWSDAQKILKLRKWVLLNYVLCRGFIW